VSATNFEGLLTVPITPGRDHITGPAHPRVSLLEYGDFECPFCGLAYSVVEALRQTMRGQLLFAYRHFPITTSHRHAWKAAEASEAAAAQGQFWQYHRLLFTDQAGLDTYDLIARARVLGLDVGRFESELVRHVYSDRVQEDFLGGVRSGVQGTPTFFIDRVRYDGPPSYDAMLAALQGAAAVASG
jgi:protein-disulfide isomerase